MTFITKLSVSINLLLCQSFGKRDNKLVKIFTKKTTDSYVRYGQFEFAKFIFGAKINNLFWLTVCN